jgi:predicted hydrocarbon binding protein
MTTRKYAFEWSKLGDIDEGRPNLGPSTSIQVYRLMQYTMRDVLEVMYGSDMSDEIFRKAGELAGKEFYKNAISPVSSFHQLIAKLTDVLRELNIGVLRLEKADIDNGKFILTVSEDLDCSGLPDTGEEICAYDEGFIAGILDSFTGATFKVREVDCWCTGDRTCRFEAEMINK